MVFAIYLHESATGIHVSPHSETPSHVPPHPIPLSCPWALASGALLHALNSPWSPVLHIIMYMFQCYSLKSSHPYLLPLSPKVSSLYLCLLCCAASRTVITTVLSKFHIYVLIYSICLPLSGLVHFV